MSRRHKALETLLLPLEDGPDGRAATRPAARLHHGLFCIVMAAFCLLILVVGGVIGTLIFQMAVAMSFEIASGYIAPDQAIPPLVWVPVLVAFAALWYMLVGGPTIWLSLGFLGALLGLASAIAPPLARAPAVIRTATGMARLARWALGYNR